MEGIYRNGQYPDSCRRNRILYSGNPLYDIDFTENGEDTSYRKSLEALAEEEGAEHLHEMLKNVDPVSAE